MRHPKRQFHHVSMIGRAVWLFLFPPMPPKAPRIHAARTIVFASLLAFAWCGAMLSEDLPHARRAFGDADLKLRSAKIEPLPAVELDLPFPLPPAELDRYAGAQAWCEPAMPRPCRADPDCEVDAGGRATRCVRPYWAKGDRKDERVGFQ